MPAHRSAHTAQSPDKRLLPVPLWILDVERQQLWWANDLARDAIADLDDLFTAARSLWQQLATGAEGETVALYLHGEALPEPLPCWCTKLSGEGGGDPHPPLLVLRGIHERERQAPPDFDRLPLVAVHDSNGRRRWQDPLSDRHCPADGFSDVFSDRFADRAYARRLFDRVLRNRPLTEVAIVQTHRSTTWHQLVLYPLFPPYPQPLRESAEGARPPVAPLVLSIERAASRFSPNPPDSDRLLAQALDALHVILTHADPRQHLPAVLEKLAVTLAVDRATFCERSGTSTQSDDDNSRLVPRAQWHADLVAERAVPLEQHLHANGRLHQAYDCLQRGWAIASDDEAFDSHLSDTDRAELLQDTKSAIVFPILLDGQLWGTLSFEMVRERRHWTTQTRDILQSVATSLGSALARTREARETARRDRLLDGANWANHLLLARSADSYDESLVQALQLLGMASAADRAYIVQNSRERTTAPWSMRCCHEWHLPHLSAHKDDPCWQHLPYEPDYPDWYASLERGYPLSVKTDQLPDRARIPFAGVRQTILVPIEAEQQFWGFLALDFCQDDRDRSDTELLILRSAAGSFGGAIARHQTRQRLAQRDRILNSITRATTHLLAFDSLEDALERTLVYLGEGSGADVAAIFQQHRHPLTPKQVMSLRYEWVAPGVPSNRDDPYLQNMPYEATFYPMFELLARDRTICERVCDLVGSERTVLESYGVQSLLLLPIRLDESLWGFLYFARYRSDRLWNEGEQALLTSVAGSIGASIARHQAKEELAHLNAELEHRIWKRTAELQTANRKLTYNAYHDALTGLPNRALLLEQLENAIAQYQRDRQDGFALLFVDLDRFKTINDSLGHDYGDRILIETASRLIACLSHGDIVARLGGDEFAVLLRNVQQIEDATRIAERAFVSLSRPFQIDECEVYLSASIGIAGASERHDRPEDVLRDADIVMLHAKASERQHYTVFDRQMHDRLLERHQLENDFRRDVALLSLSLLEAEPDHTPFRVLYQPIVSLSDERIVGFEALVRWHHPQKGNVPPTKFIPIAEDGGQIIALGSWVLRRACSQLQQWRDRFPELGALMMSVNLSACQLADAHLVAQVDRILDETGIAGRQLKLEITESVLIDNDDFALRAIADLRERQIQFCMDDFGTGYSSLSYLHRFSFDTLKIDRAFVSAFENSNESSGIVQAILTLADNMKMTTVAEGIETTTQRDALRRLGCQLGQGYLFAPPLEASTATAYLTRSAQVGKWISVDVS